jgi:predicted oxidoreductase
MVEIAEHARGSVINKDRMWHYTEGLRNFDPVWTNHGIRILPGPSSFWCDADGNRFAAPAMPGFDTLGTLNAIRKTGADYSWFILTKAIIKKEFALSGSEQNPDLTNKNIPLLLKRLGKNPPGPVQAFMDKGEDFIVRDRLEDLVEAMNTLSGEGRLSLEHLRGQIEARDREIGNPFSKDAQVTAIRGARNYLGDRLMRTAKPHRLLDPDAGPLIAVRLNILTRKTLGGLQTDLNGRVLELSGAPVPGLYAAGEVAGFGGGGMHGYNALEGTFLGGCLVSGRIAGRSVCI